ncbi:MAG: ROK family protein, partial [Bacteroidales bacterium]|nr:ROK family protein [Bacteroidales bacterium]
MNKLAIGVDIGGTNTAMGVVDSLGNVVLKSTLPTPVHGDVHAFVSDMAVAIQDMVDAVTKLNEQSVVQGIGIGA